MQEFYRPCSDIFDNMNGQTFILNSGVSSFICNSDNTRLTMYMNKEKCVLTTNITSDKNNVIPPFIY